MKGKCPMCDGQGLVQTRTPFDTLVSMPPALLLVHPREMILADIELPMRIATRADLFAHWGASFWMRKCNYGYNYWTFGE